MEGRIDVKVDPRLPPDTILLCPEVLRTTIMQAMIDGRPLAPEHARACYKITAR